MQVRIKKAWKIVLTIIMLIVTLLVIFITYCILDSREMVANINKYEKYLGSSGKYKENYGTYNDIFPDKIPASAEIEDFCYYYYNPWDACYLGYLVYTCEKEDFNAEYKRLLNISSSENKYIYGATKFPYELCAVYADEYYGYIYALADMENSKLIYVELQFANGFTDIDYKKYIDEKYLPIGFWAEAKVYDKLDRNE